MTGPPLNRATGDDRDRDPAGRPRNARARDALGRPLPRGVAGAEQIADDPALPPPEALTVAQRLIDSGRPFQAHEVLEASWKAALGAERDLWQGLAQIAVGLTHAQRGNAAGAAALLRRGADRVRGYVTSGAQVTHGIDAAGIVAAAADLAARIERTGLAAVSAPDLRPRLRAAG